MSYCLWKSCKIWTFSDHSCKMAYFKENILQSVKILNKCNIKQFFRITVKYLFLIWFGLAKACFIKEHIIFLKYLHSLVNPPFHGSIMLRAWTNSSYWPFFVGKCFFWSWSCPDMLNLIINSATRCSYKKNESLLVKIGLKLNI